MLFKADDGKVLVGADFSQQEPRLLAAYSGDAKMIDSYREGKDLYAVMGSSVYHNKYEDNLEHYPDGSTFVEGKKRRSAMKAVLLGIMYGMGPGSLAERIGSTKEEAKSIIDNFYKGFPRVKEWIDSGERQVKSLGYVEDIWGRRRRLPNATLKEWEIKDKSTDVEFNPILYSKIHTKDSIKSKYYLEKLANSRNKRDLDRIKLEALGDNIEIINNSSYISRALRQCTNARIQGSASTMTKKAMISIYNDSELRDLGFDLLIAVHDELIGQCPIKNASAVAKRLSYLMSSCVPELAIPFKCDAEIEPRWYYNVYKANMKEEYKHLLDSMGEQQAYNYICSNHIECTEEEIVEFIS